MSNLIIIPFAVFLSSGITLVGAQPNRYTDPFDYPSPLNSWAVATDAVLPSSSPVLTKLPPLSEVEYYVKFVKVVYGKYDNDTNWGCPDCLLTGPNVTLYQVPMNTVAGTLALININHVTREIIITFRGSVNLPNYILNVQRLPISVSFAGDNGNVKVHQGFWTAADSIYEEIRVTLYDLLLVNTVYRLVFVGHSLGAPLALLTALRIRSDPDFKDSTFAVFSYGSPRIGNVDFANYVNSQENLTLVRAVNKRDLVAHVMSRFAQPVYIHHSSEVWIRDDGSVVNCSKTVYEDPKCSNSLGPNYSLHDHTTGYFGTDFTMSVAGSLCQFLEQMLVNVPSLLNMDVCKL